MALGEQIVVDFDIGAHASSMCIKNITYTHLFGKARKRRLSAPRGDPGPAEDPI